MRASQASAIAWGRRPQQPLFSLFSHKVSLSLALVDDSVVKIGMYFVQSVSGTTRLRRPKLLNTRSEIETRITRDRDIYPMAGAAPANRRTTRPNPANCNPSDDPTPTDELGDAHRRVASDSSPNPPGRRLGAEHRAPAWGRVNPASLKCCVQAA
jgi:hypothetical protein